MAVNMLQPTKTQKHSYIAFSRSMTLFERKLNGKFLQITLFSTFGYLEALMNRAVIQLYLQAS